MTERIQRFQKQMRSEAVMIESPTDLFYLTGLHLSKGTLAITRREAALFVDGRYLAAAKKRSPCPVFSLEGRAPFDFFKQRNIGSFAFDSKETSYEAFENLKKRAEGVEVLPQAGLLREMRMVKDRNEIDALKRAASLTWKGYLHISSLLKEGISEEELALEFEFFVRKHGASGLSFEPIIAFGENSAYPHHRAGKERLRNDQVVLMDLGAIVDQYRGDLTRVAFFGNPGSQIETMLSQTKEAQAAAISKVRPGAKLKEVDQAAREVFQRDGVESLFTHGLGHGIGLETHEAPSLKSDSQDGDLVLRPGMVFTVEPGLYQPGVGGVRWEDMVLVTENGVEKLFP